MPTKRRYEKRKEEIVVLFESGWDLSRIAKRVGLALNSVRRTLLKEGYRDLRGHRSGTRSSVIHLLKLLGFSRKEIAKYLGIHYLTITALQKKEPIGNPIILIRVNHNVRDVNGKVYKSGYFRLTKGTGENVFLHRMPEGKIEVNSRELVNRVALLSYDN